MNKQKLFTVCILISFVFIIFIPKNSGADLFATLASSTLFTNTLTGQPGSWTNFGTGTGGLNTPSNNSTNPFTNTGLGTFSSISPFSSGFNMSASSSPFNTSLPPTSSFSFGSSTGSWSTNSSNNFGPSNFSNNNLGGFSSYTNLGNFSCTNSPLSNSFTSSFGSFNPSQTTQSSFAPTFNTLSLGNNASLGSSNSFTNYNTSNFTTGQSNSSLTSIPLYSGQNTLTLPSSQFSFQGQGSNSSNDLPPADFAAGVYTAGTPSFEGIWIGTWSAYTNVTGNLGGEISGEIIFELYKSFGNDSLNGTLQISGWDAFAGSIAGVEAYQSPEGTIVAMFADYEDLEILLQITISSFSMTDRTLAGQINLLNSDINPKSARFEVHQ